MTYDLVVRGGTVVDGSGMPRYRADVAVKDGRIAAIGRISSPARETVDAEGHVVAPGFVDGHTHMDAQIFWDPLGTCSCYHGVTSVVMGNCGFTLAPCREAEADLVFRNLERAEDIDRGAMLAGIRWQWETFPEYLDVLDRLPKGINYSGYIGHSALRTYVMGERAFSERASDDELKRMVAEVQAAVRAGAMGFSITRSVNHETSDDRPVASRAAPWEELAAIVRGMGAIDAGILETAGEPTGANPERAGIYYNALKALSAESGRPITFGMFNTRVAPGAWRPWFELMNEAAAEGARLFAQVHTRALTVLLSFETNTPFDKWPVWQEFRSQPLDAQRAQLADPEVRQRLAKAAEKPPAGFRAIGTEARPPEWDWLYVLSDINGRNRTVAEVAAQRGVTPERAFVDLAHESGLKQFFQQPIANEDQDQALEMMRHPRSVVTFSDAGAHVSQIMDNSLQTHLFSHWVREKQAFTLEEAVRLVTYDTATHWGFHDRGLLRPGMAADIVVFDPATIAPRMPEVVRDLPAGARRLRQTADGIRATIVNGRVLLRDNEPTGALPGRLLRAWQAA
jgi:N-acyl-D-amino-acid deacylase